MIHIAIDKKLLIDQKRLTKRPKIYLMLEFDDNDFLEYVCCSLDLVGTKVMVNIVLINVGQIWPKADNEKTFEQAGHTLSIWKQ